MKRVIERCPNCGVEHDDPKGGACEVCGTPLRFWCRVHSKEIGWLDGAACPRCAEEASRPTPPSRPPAVPPPSRAPTPPPSRPRRPTPTRVEVDEPVVVRTGPPPRRMPSPWGGRDPGVVMRDGAEDLAPYAMAGANFAVRLMLALFAVVRSVIGWGLLGALIGFFYASSTGGQLDVVWTAAFGAMVGGGAGLLFGAIRALRILFAPPPGPPDR